MFNKDVKDYKDFIKNLSLEDQEQRNIYLKEINSGTIQGPRTGYATIDKPWSPFYSDEALNEKMPEMTVYRYLYEQNKNHMKDIELIIMVRK